MPRATRTAPASVEITWATVAAARVSGAPAVGTDVVTRSTPRTAAAAYAITPTTSARSDHGFAMTATYASPSRRRILSIGDSVSGIPGSQERGHEQHVDHGDRGPKEVVVVGRHELPDLIDKRAEARAGDDGRNVLDGPVEVRQQEQERGEHEQAAPQQVGDVDPGGAQLRVPGDGEEGTNREERNDRGDEEALQEERRLRVAHPSGKGSVSYTHL